MPFIGLTGSICTGKSTVSKMFESLGARIIDADLIARDVVRKGSPVLQKIAEEFGRGILLEDGNLDREKLGKIVFADPEKLKKLNSLTHPEIIRIIMEERKRLGQAHPDDVIILDAPLLYETGLQQFVEKVIVVSASRENQMERLLKRNNISPEDAQNRIKSQMAIEEKASRADFVIDSNSSISETLKQVREVYNRIHPI
ncbi:MAG: dephospho-CoA kinase [Candidatus Schekmanbacteria bacterium]|nr:dephospho-CoA kinase [Candidatus Schekmanbacteria bacterium]